MPPTMRASGSACSKKIDRSSSGVGRARSEENNILVILLILRYGCREIKEACEKVNLKVFVW